MSASSEEHSKRARRSKDPKKKKARKALNEAKTGNSKRRDPMTIDGMATPPAAEEAAEKQPAVTGEAAGGANLEQVRDILFGSQMREYDLRLQRMEERILKELAELNQDTRKSVEALELYTKKELDSLVARLKGEQSERLAADKETDKELKQRAAEHEKKLAKLEEQLAVAERSLRQHVLDQAKSLREEMGGNQTELSRALEREASDLRATKADRAAIGELLMEMALRLNEEPGPAEGD